MSCQVRRPNRLAILAMILSADLLILDNDLPLQKIHPQ